MATVKSFTSLEQSKKLAEILPLESADMHYVLIDSKKDLYSAGLDKYIGILPHHPAWSLAALLDVIPKHIKGYNVLRIDIGDNDTSIWYYEVGCGVNNDLPDITMKYTVDACVDMIEKLHELNLL